MQPSLVSILPFFLFFLSSSLSEKCNPNDKKALLEIKKALGNPHALVTWNPKTDCCNDWDQSTLSCTNNTNRVTSLILIKIQNNGHISPFIGDLLYLQHLDITNIRNLSGPIPSTITKLANLTFFRITQTNISGPIPDFFNEMQNITYINLSDNSLVGTIPTSVAQLSNLLYLRLDRNKLTGSIPESFGKLLSRKLEFLYLGHNKLTGVIPSSFTGWSFETLDLSGNKLEGDISFLFGENSNTFQLYLSRNKFEFDFSKLKFGGKLVSLKLNHNNIYGGFPPGFASRPWQEFNVSYNNLCGKIPQGGYMIRFDIYSYIHNKCLCDYPLPACKS